MGSSGKGSDRAIKSGRDRALGELERIFSGPLEGLKMAPEFFKLLGSDELKGTPLGRGVDLQNSILDQVFSGLSGKGGGIGTLPADLSSALLESSGGAQAGRGTYGSPAGNLSLANEFAGASEAIRAQRLNQAFAGLQGTSAAGSVLPSASQFLQVGAQRALAAADVNMQAGGQLAQYRMQADQQQNAALSSLLGIGLGAATGGVLGLAGAGGLFGTAGGLGGLGSGAALGSGLLPTSLFSGGLSPFGSSGGAGGFDLQALLRSLGQASSF